ncbi:MAG: 50S ribosomal protein L4 [Candidatus Electrothrix sp. LOE1_4_5]|jgi:large subunit ribosomal protein L4|nr:50S ribosomal protein L4 [Candidatus Electrothrix sp. AX1]MCI5118983.1 50S ribosomal protein L4 [Candidatus Electrothrix gigas]MCI5180749.1 50S ribosomal protein L4 [Candidatus Electrothrix gigas]MCI5183895.1 50S ribosomal protein L4 [Candidatus Electrothrix gigas]MCI5194156.1 50S ribosomal protein L4 [Candidatus Electrothrix gigas]
MSVCDVVNTSAEKVAEIEVNDNLFGVEVDTGILHEVVCMQRANRRRGTASTKTRGEVRGGGAKPWRQKGTGRARAGTNNSPIWRGGGTTFGPKPRDYSYSMPKKVRRLALRMALSARMSEGNVVILDQFAMDAPKTKDFVNVMKNFDFDQCLIVTEEGAGNLQLSARNAVGYKTLPVAGLNVYDILKYPKLMVIQSSLEQLETRLMV